jgi:hypothetical protein
VQRARLIGVAALMAVALIAAWAQPASAFLVQNTDWIQGRAQYDWYEQGSGYPTLQGTTGVWLTSINSCGLYLATAGHLHEDGAIQAGFGSPPFASVYERSVNNRYDGAVGTVLHPTGSWAQYDMKLISFGCNAVAADRRVWNYCAPYPNCSSYAGGGTNSNWAGTAMNVTGGVAPWAGMSICKSGARTGTSCGTVQQGFYSPGEYGNYYQWLWFVTGVGNCGVDEGDSGAPVYLYNGANNTVQVAGILVASYDEGIPSTAQCGLWGDAKHNANFNFIPISSWISAWSSLNLVPLT